MDDSTEPKPQPATDEALDDICGRWAQAIVDTQEELDRAADEAIQDFALAHKQLGTALDGPRRELIERLAPPLPDLSSMRVDVELELRIARESKAQLAQQFRGRTHCAYRELYFGQRQGHGQRISLTLRKAPHPASDKT